MIDVDLRVSFIEGQLVDKFDRPIVCYPWMIDEVFRPLRGFKPEQAGDRLCTSCTAKLNTVCDTKRQATRRAHKDCDGLTPCKIRFVILKLKRQQGKTTTMACIAISDNALERNITGVYLGTSEDQGARTYDEKFRWPVERNPELEKRIDVQATKMINPKRNNVLKYIPASPKASVGASTRRLYIDEARDLGAKVIMRILPTLIAADADQCPNGCGAWPIETTPVCPQCGVATYEEYGVGVIGSNAGEDQDWFYELVTSLHEEPDAAYHLFDTAETINDNSSVAAMDVITRRFGKLPSTEHLVMQEFGNTFTREGDEFLPRRAIDAHTAIDLYNEDQSASRCVAFLDASRTADLTSLVCCVDVDDNAFDALDVSRIDVWDPKTLKGGRVNYREVREHVRTFVLAHPRLIELRVDVAMISDAEELVDWARRQPWGRVVRPWRADRLLNREAWDALERRMLGEPRLLRIPKHKRLIDELMSLRLEMSGTSHKVIDRTNNRSKGRMHRDISYSLAGCCWLADQYRIQAAKPAFRMEGGGRPAPGVSVVSGTRRSAVDSVQGRF